MEKQNIKDLGWDCECDDIFCSFQPQRHSHCFELKKSTIRHCCNSAMKAVQIYESKFAHNELMLRNVYTCDFCGRNDGDVLFHGQPRSYYEIYLIAKSII